MSAEVFEGFCEWDVVVVGELEGCCVIGGFVGLVEDGRFLLGGEGVLLGDLVGIVCGVWSGEEGGLVVFDP